MKLARNLLRSYVEIFLEEEIRMETLSRRRLSKAHKYLFFDIGVRNAAA